VAGLRCCYTDFGAGPPVVILASTLVRAKSYRWTAECLATGFRVITVEMPGTGRAARPPSAWGFEDYGRWVAQFLETLRLDDVTLVGHSNSGGAAMVAAAQHPQRIARLLLVDSVGGDVAPSITRVLVGRAIDALLEPRLTVYGWHHVLYNALFHPVGFFRQLWRSVHEDLRPWAARVRVPTLVGWGARDHTLPPRCGLVLRDEIPGAEFYLSPEGSHDWLIVRAGEFAAVVGGFVGGGGCGGGAGRSLQSAAWSNG
jgi:pimeloyl-ACP methyl ester carboxylesterase